MIADCGVAEWQDVLPTWARDTAQEWKQLASQIRAEKLTALTFEPTVMESDLAWVVRRFAFSQRVGVFQNVFTACP